MLGTYGTSAYKSAEDFISHKDYLEYMYGSAQGFITRSVIPQERKGGYYETFNRSGRLIHRNSYYGVKNVYTSMNTFLTRRNKDDEHSGRKVENLKHLNALYLDLDCYKIGLTQEQVLAELEDTCFGHNIPVPTFVIDSGRGLYLIWKISEDRNALPRWTSVMNYLFEQCKDWNADPQALDAARILRVPYSVNAKNGKTVRIMRFNDVRYTLHELIKEYDIKAQNRSQKPKNEPTYPYGQATEKQRRVAQWQAAEFGLDLPDFENYEETFEFIRANSRQERPARRSNILIFAKSKSLNNALEGRVNDLFKLFSMRRGEDCSREYALFLCRLWTAERTNDFDYALELTQALNRSFDKPFDERYVATRTKSAETILRRGKTYQYGVAKLIKVLGIREEEQKELEYLCIQPQSSAARRQKTNRRAYLSRLEKDGKKIKQETVRERREAIAAMLAEGKEKEEICAALSVSARTYDRDKAAIIADGLLSRAQKALEEAVAKVKTVAEKAVEAVTEAVDRTVETIGAAVERAQNAVSPFFKSINYKRSPYGASARAGASEIGYQFTLWDYLLGDSS